MRETGRNHKLIRDYGRLLFPTQAASRVQRGFASLTAEVGGEVVADRHRIEVQFMHHENSVASIQVYWEDAGVDFQALGLPGTVSAAYQRFALNGLALRVSGHWNDGRQYSMTINQWIL